MKINKPFYIHSFANQYLNETETILSAEETTLCQYNGRPNHNHKKIMPRLKPEENTNQIGINKRTATYQELQENNIEIYTTKPEKRYYAGQKVRFYLGWGGRTRKGYPRAPNDHSIEYDTDYKAFRLVGKNAGLYGVGPWFHTKRKSKPKDKEYNIIDLINNPDEFLKSNMQKMTGVKEEIIIDIPELPVMITESQELVCIPDLPDEPRIGIFGKTGQGKTYLAHSILDIARTHQKWKKRIAILNDTDGETKTWCLPNNIAEADLSIMRKYNLKPSPMPCIYLHPSTGDDYTMIHPQECGYKITLPYKNVINRFYNYFKLGESGKYLKKIKDKLLECKTLEDVEMLMDSFTKEEFPRESKNKITALLTELFEKKLMDVNTGIPSYWNVNNPNHSGKYSPLITCLIANVVPVFYTENLLSQEFFPQYFQYNMNYLFWMQNNSEYFIKNNIQTWLFIDEIHTVSSSTNKTVAHTITSRLVREGRKRRIGVLIADQVYQEVEKSIRSNLRYVFVFNTPSEAQVIAKEYNLDKRWISEIKEIPVHNCVAFSKDAHFIVYDKDGKKRKEKGPLKGKSIPTLSLHKKPLSK